MSYLLNINYLWILVAILFLLLNILFQSLSQYRFLKEIDNNYKFSSCVRLMLMAMFFNGITPFQEHLAFSNLKNGKNKNTSCRNVRHSMRLHRQKGLPKRATGHPLRS